MQARGLVGARVRPRVELAPAAWCGRVVGAELAAGGWELLVQGALRGAPVFCHCGRADFERLLRTEGSWTRC
jgi:hypothetical protein